MLMLGGGVVYGGVVGISCGRGNVFVFKLFVEYMEGIISFFVFQIFSVVNPKIAYIDRAENL